MNVEEILLLKSEVMKYICAHLSSISDDISGEIHLQYNEAPTWIRLRSSGDLSAAVSVINEAMRKFELEKCSVKFTFDVYLGKEGYNLLYSIDSR